MAIHALSDAERARVAAAVTAAEARSTGEVVPVLSARADGYWDVALAWSAFVALLALAVLDWAPDFYLGLVSRLLGRWGGEWTPREVFGIALLVATLKFAGMTLIQLWQPLRLLLVPPGIKRARVHARALTAFRLAAQGRTTGRSGVLVYLSLAEHQAAIIADKALDGKVAPEAWGDAMVAMIGELRQGRVAEGLVAAIDHVGDVLARELPGGADDANAIPDALIEI